MQKLFFIQNFCAFQGKNSTNKACSRQRSIFTSLMIRKGARRDPRSFVTDLKKIDLLFSTVTSRVCGLGLGLTLVCLCGPLRELVLLV